MNINSNYSVKQLEVSNTVKNATLSEQPQAMKSDNVNFTGWASYFKPAIQRPLKIKGNVVGIIEHAGAILDVPEKEMMQQVRGKTQGHIRLLNVMVDRYNATNFGRKENEKEDIKLVMDLFNRIKTPTEEHIGFINRSRMSMTDIHKCFDRCEDNPEKLSSLEDMYIKLATTHRQADYMKQIIDSPNMKEYVENIDKYLPHLTDSASSKGLIAKIDKQIAQNSDEFSQLYENLNVQKLLNIYPKTSVFNKEDLISNYSKEGASLLYIMNTKFAPTKEVMEAGDAKGFMRIYNTTTKDNYNFRRSFINANYNCFGKREKMGNNEINDLALILEYADKNPYAKKFLQGLAESKTGLKSASGYVELFDKIGAERLSQDVKPIQNLIRNDSYNPTKTVFNYYNVVVAQPKNPLRSIKKMFDKKAKITPLEVSIREQLAGDKMNKVIETQYSVPKMIDIIQHPMVKPVEVNPVIDLAKEADIPAKTTHITLKQSVSKAPSAKKLVVIKDVDDVIKKRLGSKVYDEQKDIYANNATKMRLGMLPEIFASIKETRVNERAKGTFSRHKSVSNERAADLYRRINGKNKKLVNFMLKKTNEDGTRAYSVNDILDTLAEANRSILQGKSQSTKLNRFTAKDERAIYDSLLAKEKVKFEKV